MRLTVTPGLRTGQKTDNLIDILNRFPSSLQSWTDATVHKSCLHVEDRSRLCRHDYHRDGEPGFCVNERLDAKPEREFAPSDQRTVAEEFARYVSAAHT